MAGTDVHRTLFVRSAADRDPVAEHELLEQLPGIVRVIHRDESCQWEVVVDLDVVSDDEPIAAVELEGFEVFDWADEA
jgi:hypothetical protein